MSETIKNHPVKVQVATIVSVLIFFVMTTWWMGNQKADIYTKLDTAENQYEHCEKWTDALDARIVNLEISDQEQDIIQARIETQLAQIFTILEEIKTKL